MKELIETIVKPLVDFPDDVAIKVTEEDNRIIYLLSVNKNDMGKVIGKQGRVAKAIRTIVYAAGSQQQKKLVLEISE
ncbi:MULTISPECIES: KH domain-containing protein [Bacillaceae]|uniref:KH domain-containing protein n=1 Tax=Bacillaceae TaxID=186817 RepID=UPI001E29374E|nr:MULTISPECIES: KH domain-containing protein [Bacillaceae]MCE4048337.1 KH domain-containing protein [Bacillus sp. Au-Bac7]MCM3029010.1 KH domain-containing protein [Niallia sp. MER 6]MDL0434142.1 KH domain-containing protein [Niallia sp. SS-2023]UPO88904.1 KH domain-containing protein [Niallia sp. Man26]